jgi:hypothetical protein
VQSEFAGRLIHRKKVFGAEFGSVLEQNFALRATGDYDAIDVSVVQVERALRRARAFVRAVQEATR